MAATPDEDWFGQIAEALLQTIQMNETAAYLSRGRAFATMSTEEVRRRWIVAFKHWATSISGPNEAREMDDLNAELRLRGVEPPLEAVLPELVSLRERIGVIGPDSPGVREMIQGFIDSINKPDA